MLVAQPKKWERDDSDKEFMRLATIYETEGDGPDLRVWMPQLKERTRDKTRYVDNEAEESFQAV